MRGVAQLAGCLCLGAGAGVLKGRGVAVHTQLPRAEARWLCGAADLLGTGPGHCNLWMLGGCSGLQLSGSCLGVAHPTADLPCPSPATSAPHPL